jgi:hypothetical protein
MPEVYPPTGHPPLTVEPDAVAYIREHGGNVLLRRSPRHGCCGGRVFLPVVDLGTPADPTAYRAFTQNGITIHMEKPLVFSWQGPLTIGVSRLWRWYKLWVEGGEASA